MERLSLSYRAIVETLERHGVEYIPATAGLYVFARLAPEAKNLQDEICFQHRLRDSGLLVSPGRAYQIGSERLGWFRITFALEEGVLRRVLDILDCSLGNDKTGN